MFKKKSKTMLLILGLLIIIFTPISDLILRVILGSTCSGFYCVPNPEPSYMFFVPLFLTIFGNEKKYRNMSLLLGIVVLFDLFLGSFEILIIDFCFAIAGWLLAELGVAVLSKLKKTD